MGFARSACCYFKKFSSKPKKSINCVNFFIQGMCFAKIPFSSHYYIFDSHSRDKIGQASENGSSVLLKFLTIKHVLNFIITTYLVNSELQHVCEKQFVFFPETEISIRRRTLRRFGQGYRNIFPYKDYVSPLVKKQKRVENDNDQNCENFQTTRQAEYLLCVKKFHEKVKMGPFYVCPMCNRCLYFSKVIKFDLEKYDKEFVNNLNTNATSFDGNYYICKTYNTHTRKLKVPGQAVVNGLIIEKIQKELDCLNTLGLVLISKTLLFKKLVIMRNGQTPEIHDSIVNVLDNVSETCNHLSRERNREEVILVKLNITQAKIHR